VCFKEPVWCEVGTHVGTVSRRVATPRNISDGFYYVPVLQSISSILHQVCTLTSSLPTNVLLHIIIGPHQSPGELLCDICDGTICSTIDDRALQIIAYYHEFTLANPLMSRAKKYKIGELCTIIVTSSLLSPSIIM
jgi:hypothetical protein